MRTQTLNDIECPDCEEIFDVEVPLSLEQPAKKAAHYVQDLMRKRYHFFTELERVALESAYEILERAEKREEACSLC